MASSNADALTERELDQALAILDEKARTVSESALGHGFDSVPGLFDMLLAPRLDGEPHA